MTDERKPEAPGMSEVSAKFVDEAEAAAGAPPPSASVPDDSLFVLRAERQGLIAELEATPEDEDAALWPRLKDVEKRILTAEPQTLLGALAQLEVLASMADEGLPEFAMGIIAGMNKQIPARIERLLDAVTEPEDAVVLLRQRWENVMAERGQLKDRDDKNPEHPDVLEDERLHDVQVDIEEEIANTPTHTTVGVGAKLLQLQRNETEFDGDAPWRPAAFRTALEALGRGTMPAVEDPVLALKREWEARYQLLDEHRDDPDADDSDEAVDPFYDRLRETEHQILHTRATTPAGIAVKLVLWARLHCDADQTSGLSWNPKSIEGQPFDLDRLPVISALNNLERMAGEGAVMTDETPIESTPEKSEEILQRYLTWLDIERLNVAHRIGAYNVQEIEGRESAGIFVKVYRDIRPGIADMPLPDLVARAAKVLETVDLPPADPNTAEG